MSFIAEILLTIFHLILVALNDAENPPDDFRSLSVVPTQADILTGERPFLRRNKVDGSYNNAEHYLDVQFRLLREDFVRPLREGIANLLDRIGSAKIGALQDIRFYKDVKLFYPVCTSDGLQYKIKFDISKLKNVRWENSKRLIYGSLMCLSKDKFESFVFATVANRDIKELKQVSNQIISIGYWVPSMNWLVSKTITIFSLQRFHYSNMTVLASSLWGRGRRVICPYNRERERFWASVL